MHRSAALLTQATSNVIHKPSKLPPLISSHMHNCSSTIPAATQLVPSSSITPAATITTAAATAKHQLLSTQPLLLLQMQCCAPAVSHVSLRAAAMLHINSCAATLCAVACQAQAVKLQPSMLELLSQCSEQARQCTTIASPDTKHEPRGMLAVLFTNLHSPMPLSNAALLLRALMKRREAVATQQPSCGKRAAALALKPS
jgi:hypothetical protein